MLDIVSRGHDKFYNAFLLTSIPVINFYDLYEANDKYWEKSFSSLDQVAENRPDVTDKEIETLFNTWTSTEKKNKALLIWLEKKVTAFQTYKMPRDRHLYIKGGGSNGKSSFIKWLNNHFS